MAEKNIEAEKEELRQKLLDKGFTAPNSWGVKKLESKLAELNSPVEKPPTESSEQSSSSEGTDESDDLIEPSSPDDELDESSGSDEQSSPSEDVDETDESSEQESTSDDLDENADDAEDLDDKVWVKSKASFSNERLNLRNVQIDEKIQVSAETAEFLVKTDRTCEYFDK